MKLFIAIAAAMTLGSAVSLADDSGAAGAAGGKHWAACATELQKFCADVEKGKGKKRACLEQHAADLSDGCKARMAEHGTK